MDFSFRNCRRRLLEPYFCQLPTEIANLVSKSFPYRCPDVYKRCQTSLGMLKGAHDQLSDSPDHTIACSIRWLSTGRRYSSGC